MLDIKKFGKTQYGVWVIGTLKYNGLEVDDLFNTTLSDTTLFEDKSSIKVKSIKISRNPKTKLLRFTLDF